MADQPSLGSLMSNVIRNGRNLLTAQVALTRTEAQQAGQQVAVVSVFGVVAVAFASMAGIFALIALAYGFVALGMPTWAGFLTVTGILIVLGAIAAGVAKARAGKITGLHVAEREWQATSDAVSQALSRPAVGD